jgi:biopolymer transport protein ExbB
MNLALIWQSGDPVLVSVFGLLLLMSVVSWCLILLRSSLLIRIKRGQKRFLASFWKASDWNEATGLAAHAIAPEAKLARAGWEGLTHYRSNAGKGLGLAVSLDDYLVRTLRTRLSQENARLELGLSWLATVGSISPFVGLFGTVWGIYHALVAIATKGDASLATVAGPIGEALVATAAGLAVAIPAVVAYNAFIRANRVIAQGLDGFAHDLHAQLLTAAAVEKEGK